MSDEQRREQKAESAKRRRIARKYFKKKGRSKVVGRYLIRAAASKPTQGGEG